MITIDNLVFIVIVGMVVASLAMILKTTKQCDELRDKLINTYNTIRHTEMQCTELTKKMILLDKEINMMKGDRNTQVSLVESQITELNRVIDVLRHDTVNAMNAIHEDILTRVQEKLTTNNDIAEVNVNDNHDQHPESYHWIFPGSYQASGEECPPVIGKRYLVVGTIKGLTDSSGEGMIFTDHTTYLKNGFFTDNDQRFDKVYAYVQEPSSADIWQKVMSLAIEAGGVN